MHTEEVIWGTGKIAEEYIENTGKVPDFFIDNDIKKQGQFFRGRVIKHPSSIADYSKMFIVVANSFYMEIKQQLIELGLVENQDFTSYQNLINNNKRVNELVYQVKKGMEEFKANYKYVNGMALIFGAMISFDTNSYKMINKAQEIYKDTFLLMSETDIIERKDKESLISFPYFTLPQMFWLNYHLKENSVETINVEKRYYEYVESKDYMKRACLVFEGKNKKLAKGYAPIYIATADLFLREILNYVKPRCVFMWNMFYPFHILLDNICKEYDIPVRYIEFGVLAGTYNIEKTGQMGESLIAQKPQKFKSLELVDEDRAKARLVYQYLNKSRINRKEQPDNTELEAVKRQLKGDRPIVVYAGQNDYESGMYPYTDRAKEYHSPIFSSSNEAAFFLAELCEKKNWNFIYKPHPICVQGELEEIYSKLPSTAFLITKCNINDLVLLSDVVVTILSATAYVSLIQEKATVMLGYTQLKDDDSVYQAFSKNEIEHAIERAIQEGFTDEQKKAFEDHIARLIKFYLFDDMSERELRYGQSINDYMNEKFIF